MTADVAIARLEAMNAVLGALVRHGTPLTHAAFEEIGAAVTRVVPFARMAVFVPEQGPTHRTYSLTRPPSPVLSFGGLTDFTDEAVRRVYGERRPHFVDDARGTDDRAQIAARAGVRSFVLLPARAGDEAVASLAISFAEPGAASAAPLDFLQEVADVLGASLERAIALARDRRLAMILGTSGDAMLAWDRDGRVTDANAAAANLTARTRDELIGMSIANLLVAPSGSGALDAVFAAATGDGRGPPGDLAGSALRLELCAKGVGPGEVRRVMVAATITAVEDDALVAAHALLRDLTGVVEAEAKAAAHLEHIRRLEEHRRTRLVQNDRLATIGTLAAGVVHEINNPAGHIRLGLDLLSRHLTGPGVTMDPDVAASAKEQIAELRDSIRRIVDITGDLRLFASPPGAEGAHRSIVDVNRTVQSAINMTRAQIIERARLAQNMGEVPPVLMDDGRLAQVIVNLLVNAAQAISRPTRDRSTDDHRVTVSTSSDGERVDVVVEDTGEGIPRENLDRIWQPFFTTKGADVGTGLGLSISREIIERAGGRIRVESPACVDEQGPRGARFVITLPAAGSDPPPDPGGNKASSGVVPTFRATR